MTAGAIRQSAIELHPNDSGATRNRQAYPRGRTINCFWRQDEMTGPKGFWFWQTPKWTESGELLPEKDWTFNCFMNMEPSAWMPAPELPTDGEVVDRNGITHVVSGDH